MTLHIKESGTWQQVNEVHYKKDNSWERVKEVYIKKNGQWETVLYEENTQTITSTGAGTIDVPHGAFRALITLEGGNGGKGGHDGNGSGGDGGSGASISAVINVEPFTTLSYEIASGGTNGGAGGGRAGGAGGTGFAPGGAGGRTGSYGWSGSGGGGGGASSLTDPAGNLLIVASGGAGGGGAGNQANKGKAARDADASSEVSTTENPAHNGGTGQDCQTADGGGAGGGGGGVNGPTNTTKTLNMDSWGYNYAEYNVWLDNIEQVRIQSKRSHSACTFGYSYGITGNRVWVNHGCRGTFKVYGDEVAGLGGLYSGSYDTDGYPGEGGRSYVNLDIINEYSLKTPTSSNNEADGRLTITWLPE